MPYRIWSTVSFPTHLFFRYHLPLKRVYDYLEVKNWFSVLVHVSMRKAVLQLSTELEFLKSLWGLGTEEELGYRAGEFRGPKTFKNTSSVVYKDHEYLI